jgi:hypothetical protein
VGKAQLEELGRTLNNLLPRMDGRTNGNRKKCKKVYTDWTKYFRVAIAVGIDMGDERRRLTDDYGKRTLAPFAAAS